MFILCNPAEQSVFNMFSGNILKLSMLYDFTYYVDKAALGNIYMNISRNPAIWIKFQLFGNTQVSYTKIKI